MIIHFCEGRDKIARAIQLATLSNWSHVAAEIGGVVYEATMADGVIRRSAESFYKSYPDRESTYITCNDHKALAFFNEQLGKEYDYKALVALPLRVTWEDEDKWFCSELIAKALVRSGALYVSHELSRITPRDLWLSRQIKWIK